MVKIWSIFYIEVLQDWNNEEEPKALPALGHPAGVHSIDQKYAQVRKEAQIE